MVYNAPDAFQSPSYTFPADPVIAVGPDTVITAINSVMTLYDKSTHVVKDVAYAGDLFEESPFDPWIVYDEQSSRYFISYEDVCTTDADVNSGTIAVQSSFAPLTGPVAGELVSASPLTACTAVADLTGKVALIQRGGCNFSTKVANAQAAGAIAVIVYNSIGDDSCPFSMGGSSDGITIPAVMISETQGTTLNGLTPTPVTIDPTDAIYNNQLYLAVSKTDSPATMSATDWYTWKYTGSPIDDTTRFFDYPKFNMDDQRVFVTGSGLFFGEDGNDNDVDSRVWVMSFNKQAMLNGDPLVLEGGQVLLGVDTDLYLGPSDISYPKKDPFFQRSYFVSWPVSFNFAVHITTTDVFPEAMRIWRTQYFDPTSFPLEYVDVPFTKPISFVEGFNQAGVDQPVSTESGVRPPPFQSTDLPIQSVVHNNSLWVAHTWTAEGGRTIIRWYEYDISLDATQGIITEKQSGDIVPQDGTSEVFWPAIAVDKHGSVAITFAMAGPDTPITMGYTGRHWSDPDGTIRYPIQVPKRIGAVYDQTYFYSDTDRQRWGDYSGLALDPSDGETFYAYNMYPDDSYIVGNTAPFWTTGFATFRITKSTTAPRNPTTSLATVGTPMTSGGGGGGGARKREARNEDDEQEEEDDRLQLSFGEVCHMIMNASHTTEMPRKCVMKMAKPGQAEMEQELVHGQWVR